MMRVWSSVVLIATCAAAVAAAQRPSRSVPIRQAVQIGAGMFEPGDTPSGGNGQPVDGIEGSSQEMLAVHIHAHLSIFDHGRQIAVPYAIGFVRPFRVENGFVGAARGIYWLHTHDATGIIHVESPDPRTYTLGNFFDIWGRPLSSTNVAGIEGPVHAYVDGKPHTGDPRAIVLRAHAQITLEVGTPLVTPQVYVFPEGL